MIMHYSIKGFLLNNAIQIKRKASTNAMSDLLYKQMNSYRRLLSNEFEKSDLDTNIVKHYSFLVDSFERELICSLTAVDTTDLFLQRSWNQISSSLVPGQAAIEFVRYRSFQEVTNDSIMYAALVLVPGVEKPYVVSLFNEEVLSFILAPIEERTWKYVKSIYTSDMRGMVRNGMTRATLYELIWKKIEALDMTDVHTIYLAPSGVLHRINLGAIAISPDSLISDRYRLVTVNSTRQLIPIARTETLRDSMVVIFGGISYDSIPNDLVQFPVVQRSSQVPIANQEVFSSIDVRGIDQVRWNYLVGTQTEAKKLTEICDTSILRYINYTGSGATESAFIQIGEHGAPPSPWLLHIGTHGFFLSDPATQPADHMLEDIPSFNKEDQPMMRSGLIMAGVNYLHQNAVDHTLSTNNGILYAEEISHLDFSNTELAVLSACDTGLGKIQGDEGVFGLQRAFKIAGAHYLIMSLWQLSDEKTSKFMETFYRRLLLDGESISDAFYNTQHIMRKRFIDHYDWAGFVLLE